MFRSRWTKLHNERFESHLSVTFDWLTIHWLLRKNKQTSNNEDCTRRINDKITACQSLLTHKTKTGRYRTLSKLAKKVERSNQPEQVVVLPLLCRPTPLWLSFCVSASNIDGSKHSAAAGGLPRPSFSPIGPDVSIFDVAPRSAVADWLTVDVNHVLFILLFCWGFHPHVTGDGHMYKCFDLEAEYPVSIFITLTHKC